jgi:hypothetical protein
MVRQHADHRTGRRSSDRATVVASPTCIPNIGFNRWFGFYHRLPDLPDLKIGDTVVFIEDQEDANGQLILSRKKVKIKQA